MKPETAAAVQYDMDSESVRRFGVYALDLDTGELRRDGQPVPLQRQPARVLTVLVSRPGALVTREHLQAAVWGETTHVDFDRGLNYCIRHLRDALDDDAKAPRFIETVTRQGYRFVAAVEPSGTRALSRRRRVGVALATAAAVLLLALGAERAVGVQDPRHHEIVVAVVRALHDFVF